MTNAEGLRTEGRKFFIGDMKQELASLQARFGLDEHQLAQIEAVLQWSYNSGFNTGMSCGRQMNVHELMTPDVPSWN